MKKHLLFCIYIVCNISLYSQDYSVEGIVLNTSNYPIEAVSCSLQKLEKKEIRLTNISGKFIFQNVTAGKYLLTLQHISFEKEIIEIQVDSNLVLEPFVLIPTTNELSEMTVTAERPVVKATSGKLIYNIPLLIQQRVVTNAFEAVKAIPNILSLGEDKLRLAGADEFSILINGQPSNMNMEQLQNMLKSMPADRITNIEVMYSTPPQYNVKGASINIIMTDKKEDVPEWQGEGRINYTQSHYAKFRQNISLLYTKPQFNIDLTVGANQSKFKTENYFDAVHKLNNGNIYNISETNLGRSRNYSYNVRLNTSYDFKNKSKLQFTYAGEFSDYNSSLHPTTYYLENHKPFKDIFTDNKNDGDDYLHNFKLNYLSNKKLSIVVDYINYKDPSTRTYKETGSGVKDYAYRTYTQQDIDKLMLTVNHDYNIGNGWNINYGGSFSYSTNNNHYDFFRSVDASIKDSTMITKQKEYTSNIFAGFTKSFGEKFSTQFSLSGNYFKAITRIGDEAKKTLWDEFKPFVNANLTYNQSTDLMYQLSFSSDIKYPPYWFMSGDVSQMNSYSIIKGNPDLKFAKLYKGQFMFMLKRKYIFMASYEHKADAFYQMPYQSPDQLLNTFEIENLNYAKTYSATFIVPFRVSNIINSRIVFALFHQKHKDSNFYDIPFSRNKTTYTISSTNTFNLCTKPNIKLDVTAFYMHGALQGIYDVKHISNISSAIKWTVLNNKAELSANVDDIFNDSGNKTVVDYKGQNSKMRIKADTPSFRITFIYRFNSYKKPQNEGVNTSRFGRS